MKKGAILSIVYLIGLHAFTQQFSARYELVKLGDAVNTHYHEAAPVLSFDGKSLYFFVNNHPDNNYGTDGSDDIWMSKRDENGDWGPAVHLGSPFNQSRSNQVFTALPDGTLLIRGGRSRNSKGFSLYNPAGRQEELKIAGFDDMNKGRFYGASISSDLKHLIIYMSPYVQGIRSNMYISHHLADGTWSTPKVLPFSGHSDDFGPFISPDDTFLYFASDRNAPGKQGGSDIYKTKRLDDTWEHWSEPVNLGPTINTRAADLYFCIDKDGNVFVSRSNSTIDGGNLDLFELVAKEIKVFLAGSVYDEKTSGPVMAEIDVRPRDNSPLGTRTDNDGKFQMRVPEVDGYAVTASARDYIAGKVEVALPPIERDTTLNVAIPLTPVQKNLILAGSVFDKKTGANVNASVAVVRATAEVRTSKSSMKLEVADGRYQREITAPGWIWLVANAEGYLNTTDSIEVTDLGLGKVTKDIYLQPIEVGVTVRLNNIYFDFDKTTLKSESFPELDKVYDFLQQNPSLEIEIAGHTDSKGSDDYNLQLSQGRAQAVVDYLINKGVGSQRLIAQGYGETKPVDTNDTEEGRASNRRVEFTVLKM